MPERAAVTRAAAPENRRYGGSYDGYWLIPPREPHLRADDARGLRLGIHWQVWTAFRDPKLVWC